MTDSPSPVEEFRHGYRPHHRWIQLVAITLFFGLTAVLLLQLSLAGLYLSPAELSAVALVACVSGYLFADFSSGVIHWAFDNYGSETLPLIGPAFIRPFRHHHAAPEDLCHHGFVQLNGNNCLVSLPMFWLASRPAMSPDGAAVSLGLGLFCLSTAWCVFGTNQFHAWAHSPQPPGWVARLQTIGLVLNPEHHSRHHTHPHNQAYCITSGLMDAALQRLAFFSAAEAVIKTLTGRKPLHQRLDGQLQGSGGGIA